MRKQSFTATMPSLERYLRTCHLLSVYTIVWLQLVITDARHNSTANAYHTTVPVSFWKVTTERNVSS